MPFSLQLSMAISGNLDQYDRAVAQAHTSAIRSATTRMKNQSRRQMERAGLGKRLPKAFRGRVVASTGEDITRRGLDADPTGTAFSNALVKRSGGRTDLIDVFERGATIQGRPYLWIPRPEAGGRRARPIGSYPEGTFKFIPRRRGGGFWAIHKARRELWYTGVPRVRIKKRLSLDSIYRRVARTVEPAVERNFARALIRLERQGAVNLSAVGLR